MGGEPYEAVVVGCEVEDGSIGESIFADDEWEGGHLLGARVEDGDTAVGADPELSVVGEGERVDEIAAQGGRIGHVELAERVAVIAYETVAPHGEPCEALVVQAHVVDEIAGETVGHADVAHDVVIPKVVGGQDHRRGAKERQNGERDTEYGVFHAVGESGGHGLS